MRLSQPVWSLRDRGVTTINKTVLVYRNELLPLSETFIKEQVLALRDWRAVLVGRKRLNQLPLDNLDIRVIGPASPGFQDRLLWKAHKLVGSVPLPAKRMLEAEQPSLLHAHFGVDALDAWPLARALRLPMLVTLHGYDINVYREWWEAGKGGDRMRSYPKRLLHMSQQPGVSFIAVSNAIRLRAIEFGIPATKIAVSYIGIDTSRFAPGPIPIVQRARRVLFVARLVEKKGCQYLIEAMSAVQNEIPDASLIVIGDGPLRQSLEHLAQNLGVRAEFLGSLSSERVHQELNAARALCLPSITAKSGDAEGFGLVLLEAQASGVPAVTSARGGASEGIRDGTTGFSFAEGDVRTLSEKLIILLKNNDTLARMADEASRYAKEQFSLARCARHLESLYEATATKED
jgi:glycosyltransferase involved in cell wall biosynthesis